MRGRSSSERHRLRLGKGEGEEIGAAFYCLGVCVDGRRNGRVIRACGGTMGGGGSKGREYNGVVQH